MGILSALALAIAPALAEPVAVSGRAMGTTWSVKWVQPATPLAPAMVERRVADRLEQLEQQFSTYRPDSNVSRFNRASGTEWIAVPSELARVAHHAREISALTGGAFDVTVAPLVGLWGFGPRRRDGTLPTVAEIARARALVDWRHVEVRLAPAALRKARAEIAADFSSIAKGFTADAVGELLSALGAPNHLVQIGGDVRSGGFAADGIGWRVAIERPQEQAGGVSGVVVLNGGALSTSGNYRNFFVTGGQRHGHIMDPRTGRPAAGPLTAVSVIAASCATSSALATALFVLGAEEGIRLATEHRLACLFQLRYGETLERRATPEFARRFE